MATTTTPCSLQFTPCKNAPTTQQVNEFNLGGLYLYHTYVGPNSSQTQIIVRNGIGTLTVNNWVIRDGLSASATVIARGQGLHTFAGDWHNSFSLVFQVEGFKESTLQVMGLAVEGGEWAIVGGTGRFAMATGVIKKKVHQRTGEGNIIELTIQGFCSDMIDSSSKGSGSSSDKSVVATKIGIWGGNAGQARDITEPPKRLESITISSSAVVDSLAFSYVDQAGQKRTAGPWGGTGGNRTTIQLSDSEFVKEVSGTFSTYVGYVVISSIKLVTNMKTYGPFGQENGTPFIVALPRNSAVVGFFGRSGQYLDAIGVYVHAL